MAASGQAQQQQAPVNNIGNLHYQHVSNVHPFILKIFYKINKISDEI